VKHNHKRRRQREKDVLLVPRTWGRMQGKGKQRNKWRGEEGRESHTNTRRALDKKGSRGQEGDYASGKRK